MIVIGGVIVGFLLWSAIWLGGNAVLRAAGLLPPEGQRLDATAALVGLIILSAIASLASGLVATRIAGGRGGLELSILLLLIGAAVQFQLRHLMPMWYHVTFLILIVPATLLGGRLS